MEEKRILRLIMYHYDGFLESISCKSHEWSVSLKQIFKMRVIVS